MQFVHGWKQIGEAFGLNGKHARQWYAEGAPILLLGEKPVTELGGLWKWLLQRHKDDKRLASAASLMQS
ncbi:MAG: hypothetical protein IKN64_11265 [Desulfovibrio sp.]|nr:hypothetical protein [Desulfovibrio sp.]